MNERNAAILEDLSLLDVSNGVVGFVFAATVPVALILAALSKGGMASDPSSHHGCWRVRYQWLVDDRI
jgi:hypothetical protein